MIDAASLILSVPQKFMEMRTQLNKARRERRDRVADHFEKISACLAEVSAVLKQNQIPHGTCERMRVLASELPDAIGDVVGREKAEEQAERLMAAHEVEYLVADLAPDDPERETRLAKIDKASGMFSALADSLRAAA